MTTPHPPAYIPPTNVPPPIKKQSFLRRHWPILSVGVAGLVIGGLIGGAGGAAGSAAPQPVAEQTSATPAEPAPAPVKTVEVETIVESGSPEVCVEVANDLFAMVTGFNNEIALNYNEALGIIIDEMSSSFPDPTEIERATGLVQDATATISGYTDQMESGLGLKYAECAG